VLRIALLAAMPATTNGAKLARNDVVEDFFEVVHENGVGCTLEDEGEAPVGIYPGGGGDAGGVDDDVCEEKDNGQKHASQQDAESRINPHERRNSIAVRFLNDVEQFDSREDPPWVAE
jgi:hypothetical protein